jgi:hypothetical protein
MYAGEMKVPPDLGESVRMLLAVGLLALVASALLRPAGDDSYPISTYPMFARVIEHPWLTLAEGVDDTGGALRLPPAIVASDEPMQAMRTLRLTAEQGRRALRQLCARIAERVTRSQRFNAVRRVRIVRARFDPLAYFEGKATPEDTQNLTSCRVARSG